MNNFIGKPIYYSLEIQNDYYKRLNRLIKWMNKSAITSILKLYTKNKKNIVNDSTDIHNTEIINEFDSLFKNEFKKYKKIFKERSELYANDLVQLTLNSTDKQLERQINNITKSINPEAKTFKFNKLPKKLKIVSNALIKSNVSLIKSIPDKYFLELENIVYESISRGFDRQYLTNEIKSRYGIAKRRAETIARDQTHKITSALTVIRQKEAGIEKGIWIHVGAGKTQRKSHVQANGKEFELDKGLLIDGEYTFPGQAINCYCQFKPIFNIAGVNNE